MNRRELEEIAMSIELLLELFDGLPRQGPGEDAATLAAYASTGVQSASARLLDAGCGSGGQTRALAGAFPGWIAAVDLFPGFLARARSPRIAPVCASMDALPFAPASFDIVWSEGAIYIMGFPEGLQAWRPLLKPGGWLVCSEMSWFAPAPPAEACAFWAAAYPGMRHVNENRVVARNSGYEVVHSFPLPAAAWWSSIYDGLAANLPAFRARHAGDAEARAVADETDRELDLFRRFSDAYGYQFYVLRKV